MGAHGSYFAHLFSYLGVLGDHTPPTPILPHRTTPSRSAPPRTAPRHISRPPPTSVYAALYLNLVVSGLVASDFFSAPDNILRLPALPVSTVVNVLPLVVQKFTDSGGSVWEVFRVLKFELLFALYAVSCQLGLFPNMSAATTLSIGFVLYCLPPATAFFGFGNRSLVASFLSSLESGKAGYIGTGRPPPFKRVPLHQLYMRFAKSHYEPLLQVLLPHPRHPVSAPRWMV